jgi:hypothetical protein
VLENNLSLVGVITDEVEFCIDVVASIMVDKIPYDCDGGLVIHLDLRCSRCGTKHMTE